MTSWTLEGQTWEGFVWFEGLVARGVREEGRRRSGESDQWVGFKHIHVSCSGLFGLGVWWPEGLGRRGGEEEWLE